MATIPMQTQEKFPHAVDFTGAFPSGDTLASGTVSAYDVTDSQDVSATFLVSTTGSVTGFLLGAVVQDPENLHTYRVTYLGTSAAGYRRKKSVTFVTLDEV